MTLVDCDPKGADGSNVETGIDGLHIPFDADSDDARADMWRGGRYHDADLAHAGSIHRWALGIQEGHGDTERVIEAGIMAPYTIQRHSSSAQPKAARSSFAAPGSRRRTSARWPEKELTYCLINGFKPCVICTKDLIPGLFCRPCPVDLDPEGYRYEVCHIRATPHTGCVTYGTGHVT